MVIKSNRRPIIGVMGSGSKDGGWRAAAIGQMIARAGADLLCGGGRGTMESVSKAFCSVESRRGVSIGILPAASDGLPPEGYPNPWIEVVIQTHLPLLGEQGMDALSRNHINILSSTLVIILEGGAGTLSEVRLALQYKKPVVAFVDEEGFSALPKTVRRISESVEMERTIRSLVSQGDDQQ